MVISFLVPTIAVIPFATAAAACCISPLTHLRANQASWDSILPAPLRSSLPPSPRALIALVHKVDYIVIRSQIARRTTASVSADMAEAVDMRKSGKLPEVLLYPALL